MILPILAVLVHTTISEKCHIETYENELYNWKPNDVGQLPANWNWGNVNGVNYLGTTKNQHIPQYCGGCWAFATTSSISDRIAILRGGVFPEIDLSPQVLLTCAQTNSGCHGGSSMRTYQWLTQNDITDSSCAPYLALSWKEGLVCNATAVCKECPYGGGPCYVPAFYNKYRVGEYGLLPHYDVAAMQNEIYARGPITCSVDAGPIMNFTGSGVFQSDEEPDTGHLISVVGWGVTTDGQNTPYWLVRNSWGEYWGDNGYIKIYRGTNTIGIESYCGYGVPVNTWSNQAYPSTNYQSSASEQPKAKSFRGLFSRMVKSQEPKRHRNCVTKTPENVKEVITTPLPHETVTQLPSGFWWGQDEGTNYLSWMIDQHIPQYCGSCWAQAGASSIADRVRILNGGQFPRVTLAVQTIINCHGGGNCANGGSTYGPYEFAHKVGIPEYGCQVYLAADPKHYDCSPIQKCMNCKRRDPPDESIPDCWPITTFTSWYVSQYGKVKGPAKMKAEIYARGPISCTIDVTNKFEEYKSGIYSEKKIVVATNHVVSVVGWGQDPVTKEEYWIVRNSWGTQFGLNGFFQIEMYKDNLGIDSFECWWGVPSATKSEGPELIATA